MSHDFKKKVLHGTVLLTAGSGSESMLRFLRNILLARLLAPEVFGLTAIVLAVNAVFESLTEVGLKEAVIQNPCGEETKYLNGAWSLAFGRSILLYAAGYLAAPWIAAFYHSPELTGLMRVAFLSFLFNGTMSAQAYVALKRMHYLKWVVIFHGGSFLGLALAIALAFAGHGVWALVIGFTAETAFRCLLSYVVCPYLPRFSYEKKHLADLFRYARGMAGLPILTFIFMRADVFVAGKLVSASDLGLYSMASGLARMPTGFIAAILNRIMMPMFSQIQQDSERINRYVVRISTLIGLMGFPLLMFLILYGGEVLRLLYGAPYGTMAVPFAIVFLAELLRITSVPIVAAYLALGRPEVHRLFAAVRAALVVVFIYPAVRYWGLTGAASAALAAMAASYVVQVRRMSSLTGLDQGKYGLALLRGVGLSFVALFVGLSGLTLDYGAPYLRVASGVLGCAMAYAFAFLAFRSAGRSSCLGWIWGEP